MANAVLRLTGSSANVAHRQRSHLHIVVNHSRLGAHQRDDVLRRWVGWPREDVLEDLATGLEDVLGGGVGSGRGHLAQLFLLAEQLARELAQLRDLL